MSMSVNAVCSDNISAAPKKIQIDVRNVGPISSASVKLKPLTVFVGPSNTGKTYLSTVTYALHRVLSGFRRLPVPHRSLIHPYDILESERPTPSSVRRDSGVSADAITSLLVKCSTRDEPFMFSDLSEPIRDSVMSVLRNPELLGRDVEIELKRCFDSAAVGDLIRMSDQTDKMRIAVRIGDDNHDYWHFGANLSDQNISVAGAIGNMILISQTEDPALYPVMKLRDQSGHTPTSLFLNALLDVGTGNRTGIPPRIYYLPAARGGIMQSHHMITSHLVARSTRSGLESNPEQPMVSGVTADFLQHLILYPYAESHSLDDGLRKLADKIERESLSGAVTASGPLRGYPDFVYRPTGARGDVPMTRASSMVSELAPIVFLLRGIAKAGDTVIIEEPEAHLHPAAQTRMAAALAQFVRAGLRVLITTHSDWMLKEIGNLMREGVLAAQNGEAIDKSPLSTGLHPSEVGIWLFRQGRREQGATVHEVPYDQTEGVEPAEYDDVAEELYNRAAYLQNKLEESRDDA